MHRTIFFVVLQKVYVMVSLMFRSIVGEAYGFQHGKIWKAFHGYHHRTYHMHFHWSIKLICPLTCYCCNDFLPCSSLIMALKELYLQNFYHQRFVRSFIQNLVTGQKEQKGRKLKVLLHTLKITR